MIAVDAAGGDYAPHEIVKGAVKAVQEYGVEIALVGRRSVLHVLMGRQLDKAGLSIIEASQTIDSQRSHRRNREKRFSSFARKGKSNASRV